MTFLLHDQTQGVACTQTGIQIAEIQHKKKGCSLVALQEKESIEEPLKGRIAGLYDASKTLVRTLTLALTKKKDIDAAFAFELEPLLAYPIDQAVFDKIVINKASKETTLSAIAAVKEEVVEALDAYQRQGIDPERLVPKVCALSHFCKLFFPRDEYQIVIDIADDETTCLLVHKAKPLIARSLQIGAAILPESQELSQDALSNLHAYLRELSRILLSFEHTGISTNLPILFTGRAACNPNHTALLASFLERTVLEEGEHGVSYGENIDWQKAKEYASAIGAALSFDLAAESVNFRQENFCPVDFSKRYKPLLIGYFAAISVLAISCLFLGHIILKDEKNSLIEKYSQLLVLQEKPLPDNIEEMGAQEINSALSGLDEELRKPTSDMALHPDVPRVSDLLTWLSQNKQQIQLESLTYVMVKRPEKEKPKERYQVRVDLEFSVPSATLAREFHDALLAPNAFVDPKFELKWSVQRGRYRASFFLKDRTQYPHTILAEVADGKN